jgi:hypothetical protein
MELNLYLVKTTRHPTLTFAKIHGSTKFLISYQNSYSIPWGFLCNDGIGSKPYGTHGYRLLTCRQDRQSCHMPYTSGLFLQMPWLQNSHPDATLVSMLLSPPFVLFLFRDWCGRVVMRGRWGREMMNRCSGLQDAAETKSSVV